MKSKSVDNRIQAIYDLTPMQQGILYHCVMDGQPQQYILQQVISLKGDVDGALINDAIQLLAAKHDALRSLILHKKTAIPRQVVLRWREIEVCDMDITGQRLEDIKRQDLQRGFDLEKDSLMRAIFVRLSAGECVLIWDIHHIVVDGWCFSLLIRDFIEMYNALRDGADYGALLTDIEREKALQPSYSSYISWLKRQDVDLLYWQRLLDGYEHAAEIKPMRPATGDAGEQGIAEQRLGQDESAALYAASAQQNVTVSTMLEAAWGVTLQLHCNSRDVVFGKVVSGRNAAVEGIETMVALFINTIPTRVKCDDDMTVAELLSALQEQALDSGAHDYYSLADIQLQSSLKAGLFDTLFIYENHYQHAEKYPEMRGAECHIQDIHEKTNYPVNLKVFDDGCLTFQLMYDSDRHNGEDMQLLLDRFTALLCGMAEGMDRRISELAYMDAIEEYTVVHGFNDTAEKCSNETIVELFEQVVELRPDATAIICSGERITYSQLNSRANAVAHALRDMDIGRDDIVVLYTRRSVEMALGLYGVLKAGAAYLPVEPGTPIERVRFMLGDSGAKAVLYDVDIAHDLISDIENVCEVDNENDIILINIIDNNNGDNSDSIHYESYSEIRSQNRSKYVPAIDLRKLTAGRSKNLPVVNEQSDLAYCLYTSGTTGKPKGVLVENGNVVNYCMDGHDFVQAIRALKHPVMLSTTTYCFDIFATEILLAPLNGIPVILADDEEYEDQKLLAQLVGDGGNILQTTPSKMKLFMADEAGCGYLNELEIIMLGGEPLPRGLVEELRSHTDAAIFNVYGPTEATVWATSTPVAEPGRITIGKPMKNYSVYILDGDRLCGVGVPGELCIGGEGVARGYLNRPELTAERFVGNPFNDGRIYRTGDIARWLPDGSIDFYGRADDQVKIRGYRVELGEIESALRMQPGVEDAVVVVQSSGTSDALLLAYVVSASEIDTAILLRALKDELPSYMVPANIMRLERIPLNQNGKLDRKALPAMEATAGEYIAPADEAERMIAGIFTQVLGVEQVSATDSFFEIGGHSLRATRAANLIEGQTGVRIPLREVFANPTVRELAELIRAEKAAGYEPIPEAEAKAIYSMSSAQKRLFVLNRLSKPNTAYNINAAIRMRGQLDEDRLRHSFAWLIRNNEMLRTSFHMQGEQPVQRIEQEVDTGIIIVELPELDERVIGKEMAGFVRPFDLGRAPLIRLKVLKSTNGDNALLLDMHHIISDGITINIIASQFVALYNGKEVPVPPAQYKDYSEWMQRRDLSAQRDYWLDKLGGELPVLNLPLDYPRPQERSFEGAVVSMVAGGALRGGVRQLCRQTGATEYMVLLAAFMALLARYSQQSDIIIGSPVSGRTHPDCENMAGMFVNTLAIRGRPDSQKTFRRLLNEVRTESIQAMENQEYPFEDVVEQIAQVRDMSRNPLFDVMFTYQNMDRAKATLEGVELVSIEASSTAAKFDITLSVTDSGDGYRMDMEYCTALFAGDSIRYMMRHYIRLLQSACDSPDANLAELCMLDDDESKDVILSFNRTSMPYERECTAVQIFEKVAKLHACKQAVRYCGEGITYSELNARANQLAHKLRGIGIKTGDIVALVCGRGMKMITGIYGIMKSGGAYLPIDPQLPAERTRFMLEDSGAKAIVTDDDRISVISTLPVLDLRDESIFAGDRGNPVHINKSDDLAYCIYTSGTTGKPKGVLLEHRGLLNLKQHLQQEVGICESDTVIQFANCMFDASVWEMTSALLAGGTLCIVPKETTTDVDALNAMIRDESVTVAILPPQISAMADLRKMRMVVTGGSSAMSEVATCDDYIYVNAYGPTESTVSATYWKREPNDSTPATIPIGKPICNTQIYILDGLQPCGIGIPGELCTGGDSLARGYLNRPELTAEKFIDNPFGTGRLYRTGDLARWLPDGNIEYLRRIDDQVKIRGYRIELGEIESVLRRQENVTDAAVIVKHGEEIYAYVSGAGVDIDAVKAGIAKELPEYMLPSRMMLLDRIPVNRSGKLDKDALPEIDAAVEEYIAPRNEKEAALADAYAAILNVDRVGINDSFFELGGDSIKAIRLVSRVREAGWEVSVRDIMELRTVEGVAAVAQPLGDMREYEQGEVVGEVGLTPIQQQFFEQGYAEEHHFNQALMLENRDGFDEAALRSALEAIAVHHDMLRTVYRDGKQEIVAVSDSKLFDMSVFDLRGKAIDSDWIAEQNTAIQSSIDLTHGPLLKAALYMTDIGDHLMLCIHHLVVDGISWRILADDISSAYTQAMQGIEIQLPRKTASFMEWSDLLREYGSEIDEGKYWQGVLKLAQQNDIQANLHATKPDMQSEQNEIQAQATRSFTGYGHSQVQLNKSYTHKLLYEAGQAYNTEINDLLLCSLAMAVREWTGQGSLCIELEGHGRESLHKPLEIDRTVGWFTSVYPVILQTENDISGSIISIKEGLRQIPNKGIGYGVLVSRGDIQPYRPEICFNYLGHAERVTNSVTKNLLRQSKLPAGQFVSEKNRLPNGITINGSIADGVLELDVSFEQGRWGEDEIRRFCEEFERALRSVVDHCMGVESGVRTASDFDAAELEQSELSEIADMFSQGG